MRVSKPPSKNMAIVSCFEEEACRDLARPGKQVPGTLIDPLTRDWQDIMGSLRSVR